MLDSATQRTQGGERSAFGSLYMKGYSEKAGRDFRIPGSRYQRRWRPNSVGQKWVG